MAKGAEGPPELRRSTRRRPAPSALLGSETGGPASVSASASAPVASAYFSPEAKAHKPAAPPPNPKAPPKKAAQAKGAKAKRGKGDGSASPSPRKQARVKSGKKKQEEEATAPRKATVASDSAHVPCSSSQANDDTGAHLSDTAPLMVVTFPCRLFLRRVGGGRRAAASWCGDRRGEWEPEGKYPHHPAQTPNVPLQATQGKPREAWCVQGGGGGCWEGATPGPQPRPESPPRTRPPGSTTRNPTGHEDSGSPRPTSSASSPTGGGWRGWRGATPYGHFCFPCSRPDSPTSRGSFIPIPIPIPIA